MGLHAAAGDLDEHAREGDAVALDHDIDIEVFDAQEQVAHDPAHEIDGKTGVVGDRPHGLKRCGYVTRQSFLHQALDLPGRTKVELLGLADIGKPLLVQGTQQVGAGNGADDRASGVKHRNETLVLLDHDPLHLAHRHIKSGDRSAAHHELLDRLIAETVKQRFLHDLSRDDPLIRSPCSGPAARSR